MNVDFTKCEEHVEDNSAVAAYECMRAELEKQNPQAVVALDAEQNLFIHQAKMKMGRENAVLWLLVFSLRIAALAEQDQL